MFSPRKTISIYPFALLFLLAPAFAVAMTIKTPGTSSYQQGVGINRGLVGWWTFDGADMTATLVLDKKGTNNGTLTNGAQKALGKTGQGIKFDGVNDVVTYDSAGIGANAPMSMAIWIKPSAYGTYPEYFSGGNLAPTLRLYDTTGKPSFYNGGEIIHATALPLNKWAHIVGTYDGTTARLYVNGDFSISSVVTSWALGAFNIGARAASSLPFTGLADDARLYNRALSASEVSQLYAQGSGTKISQTPQKASYFQNKGINSGLVGWWTFDGADTTATTALDKSGNGKTLTNAISTGMLTNIAGKIGQGKKIEGGAYLHNLGAQTAYTKLSICTWFKQTKTPTSANSTLVDYGQYAGGFGLWVDTAYHLGWTLNGSFSNSTNITLSPGKWKHACIVYDSSSVKSYGDGILADTDVASGTINPLNLIIGSRVSGGEYANGMYDDIRIYNRALAPSEVQQIYAQGGGTKISQTPQKASYFQNKGINSGLVGWWTFDGADMTATQSLDKSGSGNTATKSGALNPISGKAGQGINFSLTTATLTVTDNNLFETSNFSVAWWGKLNNPGGSYQGFPIIDKYDYLTSGIGIAFGDCGYNGYASTVEIWMDSPGHTSNHNSCFNVGLLPYGKWNHYGITATYDGSTSTTLRIYANGFLAATQVWDGNLASNNQNMLIGDSFSGGSLTEQANAKIDDLRVYNRDLSSLEVKQLYQMGK